MRKKPLLTALNVFFWGLMIVVALLTLLGNSRTQMVGASGNAEFTVGATVAISVLLWCMIKTDALFREKARRKSKRLKKPSQS